MKLLYALFILFVLGFVATFIASVGCEALTGLTPITGEQVSDACQALPPVTKLVQAFLR